MKGEKRKAHEYAVDFRYRLQKELQNPTLYKEVTFSELLESYLSEKRNAKRDSTLSFRDWVRAVDDDSYRLELFLDWWGKKKLSAINWDKALEDVIKHHKERNNKHGTINRCLGELRSCLNHATDKKWLQPIKVKNLPLNDSREIREFTDEWLFGTLYPHLPLHLKDPFELTFLLGGERKGNIFKLQQRHILETNQLYIPASEVKNHRSVNAKPIIKKLCPRALEIIKTNIAIDPTNPNVFKGFKNRGSLGDPKTAWNTARRNAGVYHLKGEWSFRWHDIRHTVGYDMHRKGIGIMAIRDTLGHIDLRSTSRYVSTDLEGMYARQDETATRISDIKNGRAVPPNVPRAEFGKKQA